MLHPWSGLNASNNVQRWSAPAETAGLEAKIVKKQYDFILTSVLKLG